MDPLAPTTSTDSQVEIGDYLVCSHGLEKCDVCGQDFREDNDFCAGIEPIPDRESLQVEFIINKDGQPQCKKHKNTDCKTCFGLSKILTKVSKEHAKKLKGQKGPSSNLLV